MSLKKNQTEQVVESPCIRNCCLDLQDYCLGCFRHLDEITGWQASSVKEKQAILSRCEQRKQVYLKK
ncbi:MAG: DUF1289 domain-containing protein [Alteromonadaceae bacterium]|nr:DUF1289 domain-containing protein [Alteromonadaceae bacterium]